MTIGIIDKLKSLAASSGAAKAVFTTLAHRERPRSTNDLRRLKQEMLKEHGLDCDMQDFVDVFKALHSMKLGKLELSKSPETPHRFHWHINSIQLAQAALGKKPSDTFKAKEIPVSGPTQKPGWFVLPVKLRGEISEIALPINMTKAEALEIASLIERFAS